MTKRVHTFTYFVPRKDNQRPLKIHQRRDLGAAIELIPALMKLGYEYGEPILNTPPPSLPPARALPDEDAPEAAPPQEIYDLDLSFVGSQDLILQTTRPPLHDREHGDRKRVEQGLTLLEVKVFEAWKRYFDVCARSHIRLAEHLRGQLPKGYEDRKEMKFREAVSAPYKELNAHDGRGWKRVTKNPKTAVFLLRVEHLWEKGPGLLGAFGMDGTSSSIWTYRLGRDLSSLLEQPGFVFAELDCVGLPERPTDLRWSSAWKVKIVLQHRE